MEQSNSRYAEAQGTRIDQAACSVGDASGAGEIGNASQSGRDEGLLKVRNPPPLLFNYSRSGAMNGHNIGCKNALRAADFPLAAFSPRTAGPYVGCLTPDAHLLGGGIYAQAFEGSREMLCYK